MKKTLFFCLPILAAIPAVKAQTSGGMPVYELETLVVVAPHLEQPQATEIPGEAIRLAKPIDLADILASEMPEAALSRKSPLAGDLVLRGFTRDNVLITVDDTRTYCACPNRMDPPAFHVSSQQIAGVTVRTGPFSVDQGASLGGAVAVRTIEPSGDAFLRAHGYFGSYDYYAGGLTAGGALSDTLTGLAGFSYQQGGVYRDGSGTPFTSLPGTNFRPGSSDTTAFEVYSAEVGIAQVLQGGGKLSLRYGFQDASDVLYPGLQMDAMTDTMNRASIEIRQPVASALADEVEVSLSFSHVDHDMRDSFRTSVNNMAGAFASRGYFMRTLANSAYYGGRLEAIKELERAHLRYGFDLRRRLWDADNLVGPAANDMLPDVVADTLGFWAVQERREGPWAFETGARLDLGWSEAGQSLAFAQGLQDTTANKRRDVLPSVYGMISRDMGDEWNAFAGLGLASRPPDPQERYFNLNRPGANPDWVGNPDLDPVSNLELQGGLRWANGAADLRVSAFHSWLDGMVYLERLPLAGPGSATSYTNIDARLYGASADAGWNALKNLRFEAGLAWQEGVKESLPARATNDVVAEIPPLRARFAAIATQENWTFTADVQMQDDLDRIDSDLQERFLAGWTTVNLAASCQLTENLSVSGGIDNLTDETYAVSNSFVRDPFSSNVVVNESGRFFYVRLGVEF